MKFTEREMTIAVEAVARQAFEALPGFMRRKVGAASWEELPKMSRYQLLSAASTLLLPSLTALPERPTVGATPEFTDEEYDAAAESVLRERTDRSDPGTWERISPRKRRKQVEAAVLALRAGVEAMPHRQDPDALIVPDHL
ncbi:hypothetical protein [Mumia sp. Pv 4-285]|uniref:hypothetical protein n=1 Tax=Mumia qirimensis TaxID=3234852 RepID=UPI00351D1DE7